MEDHPLLTQIGLQELNERGYINLQDSSIDRSFRKGPDYEIHEIFQRARWSQKDLATMDWKALRPTLRLASRLLTCQTTICYLYAILDQANYGTIDPKYLRPGSHPNYFQMPEYVNLEEALATYTALNELVPRVTWAVTEPSDKRLYYSGITRLVHLPVDPPLVGMPDLRTTSITMSNHIIDVLCRGVSPASLAVKCDPGTDDASARLRVSVQCAITMVHELMHAFGAIHGNWPDRGHPTMPPEPYYVDSRIAELGSQWENLLFGGGYGSILDLESSPYGATTTQWPGPGSSDFKHTVLKVSKRKYGHVRNWRTWYVVSMEWVRSLFTDAFWDAVDRYGDEGLKIQRKLGVRENYRVPYKWFKDEEQVPYEFIEPPRSVLSDEDEGDEEGKGIIDRHDPPRQPSHKYKMDDMMRFLEALDVDL